MLLSRSPSSRSHCCCFFSSNPRPFVLPFSSNFINFSSLHFSPNPHLLCLLVFILTEPTLPLLSSPHIFQLGLFFSISSFLSTLSPHTPVLPPPYWPLLCPCGSLSSFSSHFLSLSLSPLWLYTILASLLNSFSPFRSHCVSILSLLHPPFPSLSLPLSAHCQATTAQTVQLQLFQAQ